MQGPLRVFKHEQNAVFLSTFEHRRNRDPGLIRKISVGEDKDNNLFPCLLPPHTGRAYSLQLEDDAPEGKIYGYPICWSQQDYEWCAYLPAVISFRYPIFAGMSRYPDIIHDSKGYRIKDDEIKMWQNVEFVMVTVMNIIGSGQIVPLYLREVEYPSQYGYTRGHTQLKFAKKSVIKSLNAFQRLLGCCAYYMAGAASLPKNLGDYAKFYSDSWFSGIYKNVGSKSPDVHILTKRLLVTLFRMFSTRNYAGIVVHYNQPCDYSAVNKMRFHGVPVYVAWSDPDTNPYKNKKHHQHHYITEFRPSPAQFKDLEAHSLEPVPTPTPTVGGSTIRYGVPPAPKDQKTYDHPMDYVQLRADAFDAEFRKSTQQEQQVISSRLKSALRLNGIGGASFFTFDTISVADHQTKQVKERWVRTQVTKHDAKEYFEEADSCNLWFDAVANQWNFSVELNIKDNLPSNDPQPPGDMFDEMDVEDSYLGLALEEGELLDDGSVPLPEEAITSRPVLGFDNAHLKWVLSKSQYSPSPEAVNGLRDEEDFLSKRYGLVDLSGNNEPQADEKFPMKLGLCKGSIDSSAVRLFESISRSEPLPGGCDLSRQYEGQANQFPHLSPDSVLDIGRLEDGYLISFKEGTDRPWKIFVQDPLTVIQIEREGWHLQPDGLVSNLIRKGLPFNILHPFSQRNTAFYPHSGPMVHPTGQSPTFTDYLAYRSDLASFFELHPHAHAAALCAGGILWRTAIDALPPPPECQIVREFHPKACASRVVGGQRYWTPILTDMETNEIVGVYRWAELKQSLKDDSWWPKPSAWTVCGLNFGAWSPMDEEWYNKRKSDLVDGAQRAVAAKKWKSNTKFERTDAHAFLARARSIAEKFIEERRL